MTSSPVPHRIEKTKNRHSRAVYRNGEVVIRLARNLSQTEEQEHIQYLLGRMAKIVLKERDRTTIDPFQPLLQGESSLTLTITGGTLIHFALAPGNRTRAQRTPDGWSITIGPSMRRPAFHRFLWKLLSTTALPQIDALVHQVNDETFRFRIRRTRLQYASSQWGSCSRDGVVMLNAVLLFLPPELLRYVIIHELAHCRHKNHSKAFWNTVTSADPNYPAHRSALRKYRITSL